MLVLAEDHDFGVNGTIDYQMIEITDKKNNPRNDYFKIDNDLNKVSVCICM